MSDIERQKRELTQGYVPEGERDPIVDEVSRAQDARPNRHWAEPPRDKAQQIADLYEATTRRVPRHPASEETLRKAGILEGAYAEDKKADQRVREIALQAALEIYRINRLNTNQDAVIATAETIAKYLRQGNV